jgi:hypothetical protein
MQLVGDSARLQERIFAAAQFALGRGVAGLGPAAAWLNGLLITAEEALPWVQLLQYNLGLEQQRLQVCLVPAIISCCKQHAVAC